MLCGHGQYMAHIRLASVAGPDGIASTGERDIAVGAKINDHLDLGVEAMHVPGAWSMAYAVKRTPSKRSEPI
jgi:hypothetical protein